MRGATCLHYTFLPYIWFQSTRPMRGATKPSNFVYASFIVSIHAPHAGRDLSRMRIARVFMVFQSTRPMRGATLPIIVRWYNGIVSIHAPHAGRDKGSPVISPALKRFNPRAPCGARRFRNAVESVGHSVSIHAPHAGRDLRLSNQSACRVEFQSTRPMRGATKARKT